MTGDTFSVQLDDIQAKGLFAELARRAANMAPLMHDIGELLTQSTKQRFDTGTGPDGVAWLPLKDGSGRTPLNRHGDMQREISPHSGADYVEITAHAKQAAWHQFGTAPYVIVPTKKKQKRRHALRVTGLRQGSCHHHPVVTGQHSMQPILVPFNQPARRRSARAHSNPACLVPATPAFGMDSQAWPAWLAS
jgi:phage virion morphogenesis protein